MGEEALGNERRWRSRPVRAGLVRAVVVCFPVGASVAFVYAASRLVPPPTSSLALYVAWWLALSLAATLVLAGVGRLSRRLLPLAALLRLSLVFPDAAPSRFRTALASGTVGRLEEWLSEARSGDPNTTAGESARRLLVLVAALDTHDSLTRGHSERVRAYAQMIGRELGLRTDEIELLNWAALLHDVGKLEIPCEILTKKGKPTDEEWAAIRSHPELGEALVAPLRTWLGEWCDAVGYHHERWDGGGYPRGIAGTEIPLAGRIVAVADVFDVITSSRSYKEAAAATAGRKEIARCADTQFDPEIVRAFLAVSLGRARFATGPFAWLADAAVLARVSLLSTAGTISAAAVAAASPGLVAGNAEPVTLREGDAAARVTAPRPTLEAGSRRVPARPRRQPHPRASARTSAPPQSPGVVAPAPAGVEIDQRPADHQPPRGEPAAGQPTPEPPSTPKVPDTPLVPAVPALPAVPPGPTLPSVPSLPDVPSPAAVPLPFVPSAPALPDAPPIPSTSLPSAPPVPPPAVPSLPGT